MRRSLVVAVVVGLTAVAACSSGDTDVRADPPAAGAPTRLDAAEIERRSAQWAEQEPDRYSYVVTNECQCQAKGTFRVWIVDDEVVHTQPLHDGAEPFRTQHSRTIEQIFGMFREALMVHEEEGAEGAGATATFSPDGLPTDFTVSWSKGEPFLVGEISELTTDLPVPPEADTEPNLSIVVSNQSFDEPEMPIEIVIGDTTVVDSDFPVRGQHEFIGYEITLEPGHHTLRATSASGATRTETVVIEPGERQYLYVSYWSASEQTDGPSFDYTTSREPFGFA